MFVTFKNILAKKNYEVCKMINLVSHFLIVHTVRVKTLNEGRKNIETFYFIYYLKSIRRISFNVLVNGLVFFLNPS